MSTTPSETLERAEIAASAAGNGVPDVPALMTRADEALTGGDGKAALLALGEALGAATEATGAEPILGRVLEVLERVPGEVETAVSLFARAEERFGAVRAIIEGRAKIHESAGHHEAAVAAYQKLAGLVPEEQAKAAIWERMGDIAKTHLAQPQQALIHYQAAFKADRANTSAVRKATLIYLELGREEQAKQLVDLEVEQRGAQAEPATQKELAELYVKIGEALLVRPAAHALARDAVEKAGRLAPDLARTRTLKSELEAFPQTWKDHVRRLRDAALDARDKREAAKRYLAIAQVYAAYAPSDPQIEQNVEKCLLLSPGYRPALKFLEQLARDDGKLGEFVERLKKQAEAVRSVDVAVDMWLFVAVLLAERGANPDELAQAYEKVRRVDPRNVAAIHALTELHLEHGRYDKAAVVMEAFLQESSDLSARKNTLRQLARLYEVELTDLSKAAERLEQLRQLDADDDSVLSQLADIYDRKGDEPKLSDVLEAQLRPNRRRDAALEAKLLERLMALYQGSLAAPDQAFNAGRRLYLLQPRESLEQELGRLADALARTGDLAVTLLEAAARAPSPGEGRRLRLRAAQLALQAGDRKRARALIDGLLEIDPRDKDALALLDGLLAKDASPEEHATVLENRIKTQSDPRERAQTLLVLSDVLQKLRRPDDAGARLKEVIELDAGQRAAHEKLEQLWRTQERWEDLAIALEHRARVEQDVGNEAEAYGATARLGRVYDERLNRPEDAATLYLKLYDLRAKAGGEVDADVLRALERLQGRGILVVPIAEALQPYYAQADSWRKHVEMMALRHGAEEEPSRRATLARGMAAALEEKLKSPREAFDAWCDAFVDEPTSPEVLAELERLSQVTNAHARFADVLARAADRLPDGPQKQQLQERRAALLQGVLGDQVAAIEAHRAILEKAPTTLSSLDALAEIYGKRDSWTELRDILERRAAASPPEEAAPWAARLGLLLIERFSDPQAARAPLEAAFAEGNKPLAGDLRPQVLRQLIDIYNKALAAAPDVETAQRLAWALGELAGGLAGKERSACRAELGDVLRGLERWREALQAYEASLANDGGQEQALNGIRALLDDKRAPANERQTCGRVLLQRYEALGNQPGRAHVLQVLLEMEANPAARRALVGQLTTTLVEQLDSPDDAFDVLLLHLESDPDDDPARRQTEALAAGLQKYEELFKTYQALRVSPHEEISLLYAERLAELTVQRGDIDGGLEALRFLANLRPQAQEPWERMAALYERRNDAAGVAACLEKLAGLVDGPERLKRLVELSEFYFETLEDDVRGLDTLRLCHQMAPEDDAILARLEGRLRLQHADTPELAATVEKRAALQTVPSARATLLLEHGTLLLRMGDAVGAVKSLTESLRVERDGNSTARTTDLLQKIATRDDQAAIEALDAIIEHHRAQEAWQPLVDSLEIAATKREPGEERARLLDDISQMHESALRVPQLAFMATCRALRDAPTQARLERVKALAAETGSLSDLLEVLEDVAEAHAAQDTSLAVHFLREAAAVASALADKPGQVRVAESVLRIVPGDAEALASLESIHRSDADQQALVEVLRRRVAASADVPARREALMEMARLLVVVDDAQAEEALRTILHENPQDAEALKVLDELYERTGNSAALVEVLNARVALEALVESRVLLRARLALLKLRRRGDPAGALDDLSAAVQEAPHVVEVRQGLEVLVEHARTRGAPPVADAALLLEQALRAQNDLAAVPGVIELRLSTETDRTTRATLLLEIAQLQEKLGQPALGFMTICRAVKELPEDASLRAEAERFAELTDNLEALALVYEDVLDLIDDQSVKVQLHKRMAQIAETAGGDAEGARERLVAAVQAGAADAATLQDLVRLTRQHGTATELSDALSRLATAATAEQDAALARDAWVELIDVDENNGNVEGAILAARAILDIDATDAGARAALERLLTRAERWIELAEHLAWIAQDAPSPEQQGHILARLIYVRLEKVRDAEGALAALLSLAETNPASESVTALGTRALLLLAGDARPEVVLWRAQLAALLEPRFEAAGAWGELAPVLRLRLDVEQEPAERKRLWMRIVDVEERMLDRPEQAMVTLARALGEDPADNGLRDRAERLSVRLHDLESLLGLYEDIIEGLALEHPQRFSYALRCGELYEGGVGQPLRAAEFYGLAYEAATAQGAPLPERQKVLERIERLYRAIGEPARLAWTLKIKADIADDVLVARQALFEAANIESQGLKDFGAAVATLNRLLELVPQDTDGLRALADACEQQGRWDQVAEALDRELAALGTNDPHRSLQSRFRLGVVLDQHLALPDDALLQFQAVLQDAPDHKETREYLESRLTQRQTGKFDGAVFLTQSYERTGDWQKAVEVLQAQIPDLERRGDRKEVRTQLVRIADMQEQQLANPSLAFATLCRALKNDPNDPALRERLNKLAETIEVVDELAEIYEDEAVAADSSGRSGLGAEMREAAASLYGGPMNDPERAIKAYEGILEKQPGRLVPLEALSALYGRVGRFEDVEKALRRRLMFKDEPFERAPLLVELGSCLAEKLDRIDEAVPLLEEARRLDPHSVPARRLLIDLFDGLGNLEPLRALLVEEVETCRASSDEEGFARGRMRLAVLLADQIGDVEAAIPLWEELRAIELERGNTTVRHASFTTLERLYAAAGRYGELKALYEAALAQERDPAVLSSLTTKLGEVLSVHLGGKEEAVARHLKILELDPQNQSSLNALRGLYWDLGKYEELVSLIRRMMRTTAQAEQLKDLRFQLAEVLGSKLSKRAEAVETGRRILDIEPHTPAQLERLAAIFRTSEAWDELADVLERNAALVEGPQRVARLLELATVFEENLGRRELAAGPYERVLKVDPRHERAYQALGAIYIENNDWQKLVGLKDERAKQTPEVPAKIGLLKEIGQIYEEKLSQKSLAFLAACRAFRENYDDGEVADWMDRLALETDSVDEIVTIYDDALGNLTDERRIIDTHLRMADLAWKHLASPADAELHYKRALEYEATNKAALDGMVALYESLGKWREVVNVFERRVEQSNDVQARIEMLRRVARTLDEKAEDVEASINAYKRILELDGADAAALRDLAEILERSQKWQQLINILKRHEEVAEALEEKLAIRYRVGGLWEQQLENPEQAIAVYRSILDEDPAHILSLKALERMFTTLNRPQELVKIFEKMLELAASPDEAARLLFKIGATWEESLDDLGQAVDANLRVLQIDADNVRAVENLERLYRALSDWESLVKAHETHISLTRDPQEIVQLYLAIGQVYAQELGRTDKAEQMYTAALDFDPGSKGAIHSLGALYEKSGNWFNALEKLQAEAQLLGDSKDAVEIYHRIGNINEQMLLDVGNAILAYKAALDIEPGHVPSIKALKNIALSRAENTEYLHWLREEAKYTEDEAGRTEVHTTTGLFLQDTMADLEGAAEELEKALAVTFDHIPAAKPLADICYRDENWDRAEQLLDIIVERLDPQTDGADLCRQHYRLGYVCEKLSKEAKALKNYQRAYEIDATYLPALEGLGAALSKTGRWEDAGKIYQAILIHHRDGLTDAEIVDYYQQLADLNHKLGQSDKAIKSLEKALELDANHAPSLRLLSNVYVAESRFEDAYEVLIRLAPLVFGEERGQMLIEIGRMATGELDDPYRAIDAFEDANRQRPGDKEILEALLGLYRQTRQGPRAVEVLEELVRVEQDEKARVRLNQTLGEVYRDEIKNEQRAVQYFNAALDLDPTFVKAFESIEALLSASGNWTGLEENYIAMLKRIPDTRAGIKEVLWKNLGDLYRFRLRNLEGATQAYRVLVRMRPDNAEAVEVLADLLSRSPQAADDAAAAYQRLIELNPEKIGRSLHELLRLALARKSFDRVFVYAQALKILGEAQPNELELLALYQKQLPPQAKRAMTDKLWEAFLVHPTARGAIAALSGTLWRSAGSVLTLQPKDFGLDKRRGEWERIDLDAPVQPYFVNQLKHVRGVLATGAFELFQKANSADPLTPLCLEQPTLALGKASPLLGETQSRRLWFTIGRQLTALRPAYMLPRTMGAQRFNTLIDVAVKFVDPRYPARGDVAEMDRFEKALARLGQPLQNALRPSVTELLKTKQAVNTKVFLEGMEHTAIRAGYLLTGDLELCMALLKQPDAGAIPLAHGAKVKELLLFAVSEENFELRQRLGTAIGS
jgi:golgin subfamily B member 1